MFRDEHPEDRKGLQSAEGLEKGSFLTLLEKSLQEMFPTPSEHTRSRGPQEVLGACGVPPQRQTLGSAEQREAQETGLWDLTDKPDQTLGPSQSQNLPVGRPRNC